MLIVATFYYIYRLTTQSRLKFSFSVMFAMKIPFLLVTFFRENHAQGTDRRLLRKNVAKYNIND